LPTDQPGVATPPSGGNPPGTIDRPTWILPALSASLGLIILILLWVFYNGYAQNRRRAGGSIYKTRALKDKNTTKEDE
jgi:hypothetical protein